MILSILRHYLVRLRWELAAFWAISISSSIAMTAGAAPTTCLGLARLEIVAAIWITIRVLLAEDVFRVSGGWRTRPIPAWVPPAAQGLLLGLAFLGPWGCRVLMLRQLLGMDSGGLMILLGAVWWPQFFTWLTLVAMVKLAAHYILRGGEQWRTIGWVGFTIISVFWTIKACDRLSSPVPPGDYGSSPGDLAQGIQQLLPDATDFVGQWNSSFYMHPKLPRAKLLLRVPLSGAPRSLTNARLLASGISFHGARAAVNVQLACIDSSFLKRIHFAPAILRYSDGTYGTCRQNQRVRNGKLAPWPVVEYFEFNGSFISPLSLPEYEGDPESLLAGAEVLFFEKDETSPPLDTTLERLYRQPYSNSHGESLPPVNTPEVDEPLAAATYRLIDLLNLSWEFTRTVSLPADMDQQIQQLPETALPFVLKRFPWSDQAWKKLVHPFLLKHAQAADIPELLDRLEMDSRLGVLFVEKGWTREAMPLLRGFATKRIPLELECIRALAEEKDPALAADLAAVALQLQRDIEPLEAILRNYPGLDWSAFVKTGWNRLKYKDFSRDNTNRHFMIWAAQVGDRSAFRRTLEDASRQWEREQLVGLVAGEHEDLINYLWENIDAMKFDPVTRKWGL